MPGPRHAAVFVALLVLACGDAGSDAGTALATTLPSWQLARSDDPILGLDEGDPSGTLAGVRDAMILDDGAVAVLDNSSTVRVFERDGTLRWQGGRPGEGPGEFQLPWRMALEPSGALTVLDVRAHRLTRWGPERGAPEVVSVAPEQALGYGEQGLLPGGQVVAMIFDPRPATPPLGVYRPEYRLIVTDPAAPSPRTDTLGVYHDERVQIEVSPGQISFPLLNARGFRIATSSVVPVACAGQQSEAVVTCVDRAEGVTRRIEWAAEARTLSDGEREALVASLRESIEGRYDAALAAEIIDRIPLMDTLPVFDELVLDSDARLWVLRRPAGPDEPPTALIVGPDGRPEARADLPRGQILDVRGDDLLLLATDRLGVQRIERWRIIRPE